MVALGYALNFSYLSRTDFMVPTAFIGLLINEEMQFIQSKKQVEAKEEVIKKECQHTNKKVGVKILTSLVASPDEIASALSDPEKRIMWDATILSASKIAGNDD